jgi:alpha-glucosidase
MNTRIIGTLLLLIGFTAGYGQKTKLYNIFSPSKNLQIRIEVGTDLRWSVEEGEEPVLLPSAISMELENGMIWGKQMKAVKAITRTVNEKIAALHYKKDTVTDQYNSLLLRSKEGYAVEFRAYDEGAAYRFIAEGKDDIRIVNEQASFMFAGNFMGYFGYSNKPHLQDPFQCSFENIYQHIPLDSFADTLAFCPVMVELPGGKKAVITEADLEDYPGMFISKLPGEHGLQGAFAHYPVKEKQGGHNNLQSYVQERANYIAACSGSRSFPWRLVTVSSNDRSLLNNDMVYKLASPNRLTDTRWIKPGKVAWDWWNDWNISHVDFKAGINTATYKYYIDFAATHGIEYILLDEGWASSTDIMKIVPAINLQEIIDYAKAKNVGVWLWGGWLPLDQKMDEALQTYSRMGIKGFKVDFMDRDDQKMVQFYYRLAKKAAEYHIMLDFHGAYKPTGLLRTYPNVLNFEGVHGLEQAKWSNPDFPAYDVTIPYIRMMAGPMDYTPGAMRNATKASFRDIYTNPMSQGTRCHQLAMYVVYEAPFQMLCDNPTTYMREEESVQFMAAIPTVYDETRALDGEVGKYVAIARRKGTQWFVGAMTNWEERDITLDLSFLQAGRYKAEIFQDGVNADRDATDYKREISDVSAGDKLSIHLAPGGGWAARIYPVAE